MTSCDQAYLPVLFEIHQQILTPAKEIPASDPISYRMYAVVFWRPIYMIDFIQ
jgi:hypothetical protein